MMSLLFFYIAYCYYGKKTNDKFAETWFITNKAFFLENYAHIGITHADDNTKNSMILKESYNSYRFYASGRVYCKWLLSTIELKRRHDLISTISSFFFNQEKDRINFELALDSDLQTVFCFCKSKDLKNLKKTYSDLEYFTRQVSNDRVSDKLSLYVENQNIVNDLFSEKNLLESYNKVEDWIELIYFTDRKTFSRDPQAIYISFELQINHKNLKEKLKEITNFVHLLIDKLSVVKMSANDRKESEKNRTEFEKKRYKEFVDKQSEEIKQNKQKLKDEKKKEFNK